jgi:hypothetical protein
MTFPPAIADPPATRTDLRLAVVAQWIRAGLDLVRGASSGRGLVGGAVALWQVVQAVRLAIRLAGLLAEARRASSPAAGPAPGCAPHPGQAGPVDDQTSNAAALSRALAELAAAISEALGPARPFQPTSIVAERAATLLALPRADLRGTPPCGQRPDRPPGAERPPRRGCRAPRVLNMPPIVPRRSGARRWAQA